VTGHQRPDSEILASLPGQPESMGVLYERHARAVFRYRAPLSERALAARHGASRRQASRIVATVALQGDGTGPPQT